MDIDDLDFDTLRALHTRLAVPSGPEAPRELLRQHDVGVHVEVHRQEGEYTPLPMPAAREDEDSHPAVRRSGPVIVMRFKETKVA